MFSVIGCFLCLDILYVKMLFMLDVFCFWMLSVFECFLCFDILYVWCFLCLDVFYVVTCFLRFDVSYVLMFSMFWCFLCLYLRKKVWRSTNKILPCLFHWHSEKTLPQKQCIVFVHNKKVTFIIQIVWP